MYEAVAAGGKAGLIMYVYPKSIRRRGSILTWVSECLTDNPTRTVSRVKELLNKYRSVPNTFHAQSRTVSHCLCLCPRYRADLPQWSDGPHLILIREKRFDHTRTLRIKSLAHYRIPPGHIPRPRRRRCTRDHAPRSSRSSRERKERKDIRARHPSRRVVGYSNFVLHTAYIGRLECPKFRHVV